MAEEGPAAVQARWLEKWGPTIRSVGPFGVESIIVTKPEMLKQVLSADLENPRISASSIFHPRDVHTINL